MFLDGAVITHRDNPATEPGFSASCGAEPGDRFCVTISTGTLCVTPANPAQHNFFCLVGNPQLPVRCGDHRAFEGADVEQMNFEFYLI